MLPSLPGQIEGVPEDSVHSAACENCLLNGHLVVGSLIETPAYIRILALVVFANDTEINLPGLPMFKGSFNTFEKAYGPQINVLAEMAADGNQQSPQRNMIGNAGGSDSAQEDSGKRTH